MAVRAYIPIKFEEIPNVFEIEIDNNLYFLGINYNETYDTFTIDLYDNAKKSIVLGEKLILNKRLWSDITDVRLPFSDLVPMDESFKEEKVSKTNFGKKVRLYFDTISLETPII